VTWDEVTKAMLQAAAIADNTGGEIEGTRIGRDKFGQWWLGKLTVTVPAPKEQEAQL
jgi:hypothetical protein